MPENLLEDQPQEMLDWKKYWATARRRCWYFLVPFFGAWAIVWSISWLLPAVYRSGTLIIVERPAASQVVPSNFTQDIQSRLDSITQQVLSRTRLLSIISRLNLYPEARSHGQADDALVEKMRKDVEIELVRSKGDSQLTSFNIYFSSPNPYIAQQVTTELTNALITENLEATTQNQRNVTVFLEGQLEDARKKLSQQEEKVRDYKDRHIGELPTQLASNIQILGGLQTQLQAQEDSLARAKQQNAYLESLISQYSTAAQTAKPGQPGAVGLPALDQELDRLRAQLTDLTARYTDQHPDVRKVKEQISKTEKIKQDLLADLKKRPANPDSSDSEPVLGRDSTPIMEVRSQLKANQTEIANRQRAITELEASIADYRGRLNRTPLREQELTDLNRDYDQQKVYYEGLLARKNQSVLATNLAEEQQGEHFRVMDPPSFPSKPFSPDRFKLSLIGLFVGLLAGVVGAVGAEFLDDRIYDEAAFAELVPAEIIAEVPHLPTPAEEQLRKRKLYLGWVGSAAMILVVALGTTFSLLHG